MEVITTFQNNSLDLFCGDFPFNSDSIMGRRYPSWLIFNKTYYKLTDDKLQAFRVLAMSITKTSIAYLIQVPNEEPYWHLDYINVNSIIFDNRNSMYAYIGGNTSVNVNMRISWTMLYKLFSNTNGFNSCSFYLSYFLDKDKQINRTLTNIKYIVINEDGVMVGLEHKQSYYYTTKEQCIANYFDGFLIEDFAEDIQEIKVRILPSTPKITTLKIVEF